MLNDTKKKTKFCYPSQYRWVDNGWIIAWWCITRTSDVPFLFSQIFFSLYNNVSIDLTFSNEKPVNKYYYMTLHGLYGRSCAVWVRSELRPISYVCVCRATDFEERRNVFWLFWLLVYLVLERNYTSHRKFKITKNVTFNFIYCFKSYNFLWFM